MKSSILDRFWTKVEKIPFYSCWEWTAKNNGRGYGQFKINGKYVYAHRFSYELANGPIPRGLHLDHLCRNPSCVNPTHLEPVTCLENSKRSPYTVTSINRAKTHCKNGHEFSFENTRVSKEGKRICIKCYRKWDNNRYYAKRRKVK